MFARYFSAREVFCRLAGAGFLPWCFYFGAPELELSAAAGIQGHRFLLPVGLRAMADAVVDLEDESSESSEYTVDPPVAAKGGPDVRYCPKCKTVSFLRKGACSNRKCDCWLFSGVSFFVFLFFCIFFQATKELYYVFQPGWQYNARGKDRKKPWEKGNEAEC